MKTKIPRCPECGTMAAPETTRYMEGMNSGLMYVFACCWEGCPNYMQSVKPEWVEIEHVPNPHA